jgi:hypothetical protein
MKRFFIYLSIIALIYLATPVIGRRTPISVESQVIEDLKAIGKAEVLYSITKGHGRFTDIETLAEAQFIESPLASGERHGYLFEAAPVGPTATMFDVTARPKRSENSGGGEHSFYSNETFILYEANNDEPPLASPDDRVPKNGSPLRELAEH